MKLVDRKLRIFLCHASQDKPVVRELYQRLNAEGWIDPWLDKEKLLPGQDWELEIEKSVESADVVVVCLSKRSVQKEGYYQKEIKKVLDIADEKPEGAIFVIPLRLDDCQPPRLLTKWQYVDFFPLKQREAAYLSLVSSLKVRQKMVMPKAQTPKPKKAKEKIPQGLGLTRRELHEIVSEGRFSTHRYIFDKAEAEYLRSDILRKKLKKAASSFDPEEFISCPICKDNIKAKNFIKHIDWNHIYSESEKLLNRFIKKHYSMH